MRWLDSEDDTMKSSKRTKLEKFQPFTDPTPKVREAWSRLFTTLSASAFAGAVVVTTNEIYSHETLFRVICLIAFGFVFQISAIYVLKESNHDV